MQRLADHDALRSFLVLSEELNFRRAAVRLNLDQSALSRRIRALEHELGFALFHRTTRSVALTEAGRALAEHGHLALGSLDGAVEAARRVAAGEAGRLRLSYMAFAAIEAMPRAVKAFAARQPDISVELTYRRTQAQKLALARDEVDAGFIIGPFEHRDFDSFAIASEPLVAVVPADHRLAASAALSLEELAEAPFVLGAMREWDHFRWLIDDHFGARGLRVRAAAEPSNTLAILGLVAVGLGVTLYPASIARLAPVGVALVRLSDDLPPIETTLLWRRHNEMPPLIQFVKVCRDLFHGTTARQPRPKKSSHRQGHEIVAAPSSLSR